MGIVGKSVLSLAEGVSVQHLGAGEGGVVLKIGSGELFTCNDTTAALLRCAAEGLDFDASIAKMLETFEVDAAELRADMEEMAAELAREGIVRIG